MINRLLNKAKTAGQAAKRKSGFEHFDTILNRFFKSSYTCIAVIITYYILALYIGHHSGWPQHPHPARLALISALLPIACLALGRIIGTILLLFLSAALLMLWYIATYWGSITCNILHVVPADIVYDHTETLSFLHVIPWYYFLITSAVTAFIIIFSWKNACWNRKTSWLALIVITFFCVIKAGPLILNAKDLQGSLEDYVKGALPVPVGEITLVASILLTPEERMHANPHISSDPAIAGKGTPQAKNIILVIGESSLSDRYGVYGYKGADTTPQLDTLQKDGKLCVVRNAWSSANLTANAVPMMLSFAEPEDMKKNFTEKNLIELAKENNFKTFWIGAQIGRGPYARSYGYISEYSDYVIRPDYRNPEKRVTGRDESLLPVIEQKFRDAHQNKFFIIHIYGNHVAYEDKRTEEDIRALPRASAYDQSIHRTDRILGEINHMAEKELGNYILIYSSDHADVPVDTGNGKGHALQFGGAEQYRIPVLLMGDYQKTCNLIEILRNNKGRYTQVMDKFVLLTLMGYDIMPEALAKKKDYDNLLHSDLNIYTYDTLPHRP